MCDPFQITFSDSPEELLAKAASKLELQGGALSGNASSGKLKLELPIVGLIEGVYAVSGNAVSITITEKPALLPCGIIENKIRDFLVS